jgi:hypothetical protein
MIYWFIDFLPSRQFSDFAFLGDLHLYSLSELRNLLSKNWNEKIVIYDSYQSITWSNKLCVYTVIYTLEGNFIQIKEELWKREKMFFSYEIKKELACLSTIN